MYKLTQEQKIENLREILEGLISKRKRLDEQIQSVSTKIEKLSNLKEKDGNLHQESFSDMKISNRF